MSNLNIVSCAVWLTCLVALGTHLIASRRRMLIRLQELGESLADVLLLDHGEEVEREEGLQTPLLPGERSKTNSLLQ